ncbi:retrotransposon protein, putative, ty1-copia subclass [Tanacetum coccineum]
MRLLQLTLHGLKGKRKLPELKAMFSKQAEQELLQTVREFHTYKQEEGQFDSSHVLKMKGYIDNLERLVNDPKVMLMLHEETQFVLERCNPALHANTSRTGFRIKPIKYNRSKLGTKEVKDNSSLFYGCSSGMALFVIGCSCSNTNDSSMYAITNKRAKINSNSSLLWHCRLGHISKKRIEKLQHDGLLNSIDIESLGKCVSCLSGKMARKPYSHQVERAKDLLGLIHTDVCGLFRIVSRQGASYFVTFTDDFSRYGYVYLLKHKHEVFETFKVFQKEVENQLGKTIKSLRSDRGGEYMSQEFLDHLKDHGIIAHRTPPYTPQNNGVSERRNRTLLDMTPYEIWHGQAPKLSYLKVWGCEALVKRDTLTKPDKLDPRSFRSIFIGYPKETMGYSFYNPSENKVFVARNAEFFENDLIDLKAKDDQEINEPQSDINPIRRSTRTRRPTDRLCLYIDAEEHELGDLGVHYGLKQHSMCVQWNKRFDDEIKKFGFTQNPDEPCVYLKVSGSYVAILILYVNDILLMGNNIPMLQDVKSYLGRSFAMKDFREVQIFLESRIYRDRTIPMQEKEKLKLDKSQGASTPVRNSGMQNIQRSLGYRIYYICSPTPHGYAPRKHLARELRVSCYTNGGYLTDVDNLKSQTGYVFVLNGGAVDWKSTKQTRLYGIRKFISGLGIVSHNEEPIVCIVIIMEPLAYAERLTGVPKGARTFSRHKVPYLPPRRPSKMV